MANKKVKTKSFGTSGWTPTELEALARLVNHYGTDRSKLLRKLVAEADRQREIEIQIKDSDINVLDVLKHKQARAVR